MAKKTVVKDSDVKVITRGGAAVITPETRARVEGILGQVNRDIGNAELGRFFALRAGCGLIVVKELCEHGEWGDEMVRMLPSRAARTLRRYMSEARDFLEAKALLARDVWDKLVSVGQLDGAAGTLLLGNGGKSAGKEMPELPAEVHAMVDYIRDGLGVPKTVKPADGAPKSGKLSKADRIKAARDFWHPVASRIQKAGLTDRLWELLPDEELEDLATAIAAVAVAMKQEIKRRGK
ncbi:MAG TPA: hypothetical protein P5026_11630 [Kiritimatiellia bacterium]|nr:hypothetical protein [Kiritimatiellia bacterium]HRU71496.1 hypothetical protein [Kiritimatiellia bacterium]